MIISYIISKSSLPKGMEQRGFITVPTIPRGDDLVYIGEEEFKVRGSASWHYDEDRMTHAPTIYLF